MSQETTWVFPVGCGRRHENQDADKTPSKHFFGRGKHLQDRKLLTIEPCVGKAGGSKEIKCNAFIIKQDPQQTNWNLDAHNSPRVFSHGAFHRNHTLTNEGDVTKFRSEKEKSNVRL